MTRPSRRRLLPFLTLGLVALLAWPAAAAPVSYEVDKGHSALLFRIKHVDVAYTYGRFNDFSGSIVVDDGEGERHRTAGAFGGVAGQPPKVPGKDPAPPWYAGFHHGELGDRVGHRPPLPLPRGLPLVSPPYGARPSRGQFSWRS